MLATGSSLDNLHFGYFTRSNLEEHLGNFGEIEDILCLPSCNYMLTNCNVNTSSARLASWHSHYWSQWVSWQTRNCRPGKARTPCRRHTSEGDP